LLVPRWSTVDVASVVITSGAFLALFRLKWGLVTTLATATVVGMAWFLAAGAVGN
jgi:hypothetical protein